MSDDDELTNEQVELPPVTEAEVAPEEYLVGVWAGHPNFGCPYCQFLTLEGSGAVELHILERIDQGDARHLPALEHM